MNRAISSAFDISFERLGPATWLLTTSQFLLLPREEAFTFFEDSGSAPADEGWRGRYGAISGKFGELELHRFPIAN